MKVKPHLQAFPDTPSPDPSLQILSLRKLCCTFLSRPQALTCSKVQGTTKFFPRPSLTAVFWFQELRIATTVAVVTGLFIICWTPFFGINVASALCASSSIGCEGLRKKSLRVIIRITKCLQYGNSVCNPIVYGLRNHEFRQTFHKILLGLCCKKAPLYDNRSNANGNPHLQQQSPNRLPLPSLIDRRESSRREFGIQVRLIQPVSLQFVDALHGVSPANDDFSTCPVELCNPAFEYGQEEIGVYLHDAEFLDTRL